jgi:hypothetical protein
VSPSTAFTRNTPWLAALFLGLAAAALAGDKAPRQYLDEQTGATITVAQQPLVFAYPRQDLAANAHDYATLAAAAVNRSGKVDYVIIGYFWSTADPRVHTEPLPGAEPLVLEADDRMIHLMLRGHSAREAGIGVPVHAPPGSNATPNVYGTDLATLRFIGEARHLALLADVDGTTFTYEIWDDQRSALRALVRTMSGE